MPRLPLQLFYTSKHSSFQKAFTFQVLQHTSLSDKEQVQNVYPHARHLCRILKPGDKLHVVWVTTEGGDFDNAALQLYKDAMKAAKVRAGCLFCGRKYSRHAVVQCEPRRSTRQ